MIIHVIISLLVSIVYSINEDLVRREKSNFCFNIEKSDFCKDLWPCLGEQRKEMGIFSSLKKGTHGIETHTSEEEASWLVLVSTNFRVLFLRQKNCPLYSATAMGGTYRYQGKKHF